MKKHILVVAFLTPFAFVNFINISRSDAVSFTPVGDMPRGVSFAIRSSAGGSTAVWWSNSFSGLEAFSRTSEGRSRTQTKKESN